MGNYFSSAPIDLGADHIARGYASLARGIESGAGNLAAPIIERAQMKQKAAIEEQVRAQERRRQLEAEAAKYRVKPAVDPKTGEFDPYATSALVTEAKRRQEAIDRQAALISDLKTRNDFSLGQKRAALGLDQPNKDSNGVPFYLNRTQSPEQPPLTPERQTYLAKQRAEIEQARAVSGARAEATAPYESQYAPVGPMMRDGKYVGLAQRNTRSGAVGVMGPDGKLGPLPDGSEPITTTGLQKNIPTIDSFRKMRTDLSDSERSLRAFERYSESVGGASVGAQRLADNFAAKIKTLFANGELDPKELAAQAASGQLQALVGANRLSVVGGGVMTEQDAARIIQRLGGDAGALQNPQVVQKALEDLYQDRFAQYQDDLRFHNAAVKDYYGERGFEPAQPVPFNAKFGAPVGGPIAAPAASAQAPAPASSGMTPEQRRARIQQLRSQR